MHSMLTTIKHLANHRCYNLKLNRQTERIERSKNIVNMSSENENVESISVRNRNKNHQLNVDHFIERNNNTNNPGHVD